jgi:hypothetical protein
VEVESSLDHERENAVMNATTDLLEARGGLRQFMRGLQEDPVKNAIPYGAEGTFSDNVWVTHAEVVQQFVRLNPQWKPLEETLATDSTRKYRLNRARWVDAQKRNVARVEPAKKTSGESVQFALESEPMAQAFLKMIRVRCGANVKIETERDTNGDFLVRVWPKSAAEGVTLEWFCEGFKQGYSWGKRESQGAP